MDIAMTNEAIYRDESGQFISALETGATEAVKEAIMRGEDLSKGFAPKGKKPDPRTQSLSDSIDSVMLSSTKGVWFATARHALPIEKGARPHPIGATDAGALSFFWEREGRDWVTPPYQPVQHPGNRAQPYLKPAYRIIARELIDICKRHMPG